MRACPLQVNEITQAVTPLLRTFFVGILQNPFAFEALQNFTTSPGTQSLLSGLRNATELGLPQLQRVLVRLSALRQRSAFAHKHIGLAQNRLLPLYCTIGSGHLHIPTASSGLT